mgnify:FL=1
MSFFSAKEMLTLNVYNFVENCSKMHAVVKAADRVAHKNLRLVKKMKSFEPS